MKRPIIFLDFDGVLNTEQYQARLAVDGTVGKDSWGPLFDPMAVESLRRIVDATDAGIVIASSWRFMFRLGSLRMMWEVRDLQGEVVGMLPPGSGDLSRGEEIEAWLEAHDNPPYVIIDDLDDFLPSQRNRYVEVNPIVGITARDAQRAIEILSLAIPTK